MPTLEHIAIYPIKGFPPVNFDRKQVTRDKILPQDRRFSLALQPQHKALPKWLSKGKLLQILNTNILSGLDAKFTFVDECDWEIDLKNGSEAHSFQLPEQGRDLAANLSKIYDRDLTFLDGAEAVAFADQKTSLISLLNMASIQDMAQKSGQPISWQRLRGNLMVDRLPAWEEVSSIDGTISVGEAIFEVVESIGRCAAPGVDLCGRRDLDLLAFMQRTYGHTDCGLFLKALNDAEIKIGDPVKLGSPK